MDEELIAEIQFVLLGEWLPRLIAYVVTGGVFICLQTLFGKWVHKLRSSKFTVANLFSAFTLTTLSFDGVFIASKHFLVMLIGMVVFWGVFIVGDLFKEITEIKLNIGNIGIQLLNRRKDDKQVSAPVDGTITRD